MKNWFLSIVNSLFVTLKKSVTLEGRATRKDYWSFVVVYAVLLLIFQIVDFYCDDPQTASVLCPIFLIVSLVLLIPLFSLTVRRLHDLSLTGFWLCYLNPVGLPVIYVSFLLDLDSACNAVVEKVNKVGSCWLGWILTALFWPLGSVCICFLLMLYKGKDEANEFGPSPYSVAQ